MGANAQHADAGEEMMSMTRSTAAVAGVSTPSVWAGGG